MSNAAFDEYVSPPELYFLEHWDPASRIDANGQRARLFKEFVQLGNAGRYDYAERSAVMFPTAEQVSVLRPLRSGREREIAKMLTWATSLPWLRVHYDPKSSLLASTKLEATTGGTQFVFDDSSKFNFGEKWQEIFGFYPELVQNRRAQSNPQDLQDRVDELRDELGETIGSSFEESYYTDPQVFQQDLDAFVQYEAVTGIFWLQDASSEQDGKVALIWIDDMGRVVRQARMTPEDAFMFAGIVLNHAENETSVWVEAKQGDAYANQKYLEFM